MEGHVRKRSVRLGLYLVVVLAVVCGVYVLRGIFAPLLCGILVAYILDPIADALERVRIGPLKLSRFAAALTIFVVAGALIGTVVVTGGWYAGRLANATYHDLRGESAVTSEEEARAAGLPRDEEHGVWFVDADGDGRFRPGRIRIVLDYLEAFGQKHEIGADLREQIRRFVDEHVYDEAGALSLEKLRALARELGPGLFRWITGGDSDETEERTGRGGWAFRLISWLLLFPLYTFFGLLQVDAMIARVRTLLPGRHRPRIERIFGRIDRTIAAFFRGRLLVCLLKGGLTAVGLWIFGVDYWLPIGFAAGFLSLIPYVGIYLAIVPALILSWIEYSSWGRVGGTAFLFFAMEGVEGMILIPIFLGKEIGLSPLTILVTLLIFGKLLGFIGVLLSVPLAAISKILAEEFLLPIVKEFAAEAPDPPAGSGP